MAHFKILTFQNPEFEIALNFQTLGFQYLKLKILEVFKILPDLNILAFQNPEFKILEDFNILPFQNPEFKILADFKILASQNPEVKILADFKILAFQKVDSRFWPISRF